MFLRHLHPQKVFDARLFGRALIAVIISALGIGAPPAAAMAEEVSRSGDWRVFSGDDAVRCFAASQAEDASPSRVEHGQTFAYVGRSSNGRSTQTSFRLSYAPKRLPAPEAIANGRRFELYVAGNEIFAKDEDERRLAEAIRRGSELRLVTVHETGVRAAYTFSLRGSADAVDRVRQGC